MGDGNQNRIQNNRRKSGGNGDEKLCKNQRARNSKILIPLDKNLAVIPIFTIIWLVSLTYFTKNESELLNLDLNYFDAQTIQVVVETTGNGTNYKCVHVNRSRNWNNVNQVHFYW